MDTQLLDAFISVAEHQSFSIAAEELGLTQSAVSKRIALLESQLSQSLFDRIGRSVALTDAGKTLLPRAQDILNAVEDARRLMTQQQDQVEGVLKIATSHHIGIHRLPPFLESFTQQYPEVHLQLQFIDSEQAIKAITDNKFDLAVITLPDILDGKDYSEAIQYHTLWEDPMKVVTHPLHPLQHQASVKLEELARYPAILPDTTTQTTQLVQALFKEQGIALDISMTTNHLDAIKMMVSIGLGWSALPERLIDNQVRVINTEQKALTRHLGCIHHRQRTLSNAARAMLHCLRN